MVCGRDEGLVRRVRAATEDARDRFRVFGYVDDVERLMAVSDPAENVVDELTDLAAVSPRTRAALGMAHTASGP